MILTRLNSASWNTELDAHCIRLPTPSYKAHQLVPVVVLLWQISAWAWLFSVALCHLKNTEGALPESYGIGALNT